MPLGRADRLAMLLEHLDDLPLREHDLGGSPAALMSRVVARIDRLKEDRVDAERFAAWAEEADRPREREFAQLYLAHERLLVEAGALDAGDLVLRALRLLRDRPHVRARVGARHRHVLVDDLQDLSPAALLVVEELGRGTAGGAGTEGNVCAFADDDQALPRGAGTAGRNTTAFRRSHPDAPVVRLERSFRCPERVLTGARAVIDAIPDRQPRAIESDDVRRPARCASGSARPSARRRRASPATSSGSSVPERRRRRSRSSCARSAARDVRSAWRSRSARCPTG